MENLPQIFFGILFFIIVVPFSILIIILLVKGKKQAWKGVVIDKMRNESRDFDTNKLVTSCIVVIELEDGKERKIAVDEGRYKAWNVGDKIEKVSGKMWPEKI